MLVTQFPSRDCAVVDWKIEKSLSLGFFGFWLVVAGSQCRIFNVPPRLFAAEVDSQLASFVPLLETEDKERHRPHVANTSSPSSLSQSRSLAQSAGARTYSASCRVLSNNPSAALSSHLLHSSPRTLWADRSQKKYPKQFSRFSRSLRPSKAPQTHSKTAHSIHPNLPVAAPELKNKAHGNH